MKKKKRLSGIERRWFVNNVGVIMLLVLACVLGVVLYMAAYYDTNLRSGLENRAKTTTDFFSNYIGQSYNEYYYDKYGVKAIFQGGEKNSVADVFFHGYANYEKGVGQNYLKLTSCNTTGLIRTVDCLDREIGIEKVAITIIRRVADPGDYHRGLTNALEMEKAPTHQAVDLMTIMPHVNATGILVHTPVTHGHIITVLATAKDGKKITKEMALAAFQKHPRIRVVSIDEGFKGNASFFKYARDLGNRRGDMYEIGLWEDSIVESGNDIMYAINIPQESVTIPETMDAIRAATGMQLTREEGTAMTNKYLGIGKFKTLG